MRIEAKRTVAASPGEVFGFLSDLRNHWRLQSGFVSLDELEAGAESGRVRIGGPLRLSRVARTRVDALEPPSEARPGRVEGTAEVGRRTVGRVRWEIASAERSAAVTLSARVEQASLLDRLILLLGGRRRLERMFERTLERLEEELERG